MAVRLLLIREAQQHQAVISHLQRDYWELLQHRPSPGDYNVRCLPQALATANFSKLRGHLQASWCRQPPADVAHSLVGRAARSAQSCWAPPELGAVRCRHPQADAVRSSGRKTDGSAHTALVLKAAAYPTMPCKRPPADAAPASGGRADGGAHSCWAPPPCPASASSDPGTGAAAGVLRVAADSEPQTAAEHMGACS